MTASAITATLMASSMIVIRSSYAAWEAHEGDLDRAAAADAVLRHIVRGIRQAEGVVSITDSTDATGRLELLNAAGGSDYWEHTSNASNEVIYNASGAVLADGIDELSFVGYEADGVTATTVVSDVQLIRCTVKVTLPRGAGQQRTVSCCGWIRTW